MEGLDFASAGFVGKDKILCQYVYGLRGRGIWFNENPLGHHTPVLTLQIALIFLVGRITYVLLRPLRQNMIITQILAGIIMGPSFLGQHEKHFEMLFPRPSRLTLSTFAEFGIMIHFFKTGVLINPRQLIKIERHATLIGLLGYFLAVAFGNTAFSIMESIHHFGADLGGVLSTMTVINSLTSFVAVNSLLTELNILNSEIGRLALSTSMVTDLCAWVMYIIVQNIHNAFELMSGRPIMEMVSALSYFLLVFLLVRPLVLWITNRNPRDKPMTESNFMAIICVLLLVGLSAQFIGQSAFMGAFFFGLVLPDGPPLGSVLAQKLDSISSALLVPAYCTISGLKTDATILSKTPHTAGIEIIIMAGYVGKFTGVILPSLFFKIQLWDSFALALTMCCKGIVDLLLYNIVFSTTALGFPAFNLLIFSMLGVTGIATPIVRHIYDPSRRYRSYDRKSVIGSEQEPDLKILACIHNEDNVYPLINLLEISNPTPETPIKVIVLQLMEIAGRAASILKENQINKKSALLSSASSKAGAQYFQGIVNVFDQLESQKEGSISAQIFTTIAPYKSMHDDICQMAMDKNANIVIIPFYRQWTINGGIGIIHPLVRTLNQNVLKKAPCSVGLLIDKSQVNGQYLLKFDENSVYNIAMIFLGGDDDQEAVAYSVRMARHPNVRLTIFWVRPASRENHAYERNSSYIDIMEEVWSIVKDNEKVKFKEEFVSDGAGTTQLIRTFEGNFDLVIAGKDQKEECQCTRGLTDWVEHPELGTIGDILATSDFRFSVLVIQQQQWRFLM